jgi:hypothetical protein
LERQLDRGLRQSLRQFTGSHSGVVGEVQSGGRLRWTRGISPAFPDKLSFWAAAVPQTIGNVAVCLEWYALDVRYWESLDDKSQG